MTISVTVDWVDYSRCIRKRAITFLCRSWEIYSELFYQEPWSRGNFIHVVFTRLINVKMPKIGCNFFINVILTDVWLKAINTALITTADMYRHVQCWLNLYIMKYFILYLCIWTCNFLCRIMIFLSICSSDTCRFRPQWRHNPYKYFDLCGVEPTNAACAPSTATSDILNRYTTEAFPKRMLK